jgi:hypothetical protein
MSSENNLSLRDFENARVIRVYKSRELEYVHQLSKRRTVVMVSEILKQYYSNSTTIHTFCTKRNITYDFFLSTIKKHKSYNNTYKLGMKNDEMSYGNCEAFGHKLSDLYTVIEE